jgi:hypothetical protein
VKALALLLLTAGVAFAGPRKKEPPKKEPPVPAAKEPEPPPPPPSSPQPPPSGNQRIVGVLDVRVEGVPPEIAAQFQSALEAQVDTKHFWLAPRSRMHEMMTNSTKWTEGCVIGNCLSEVKRQTNADLVLLAALTGSGTSFGYVVTLVRTDTGLVLAQESERCDVCTVSEALANATLATVKILNAVPDQLPDERANQAAKLAAVQATADKQLAEAKHHPHAVATGLLLTGLAVAAGGAGLYFVQKDAGIATAAAGGGLLLGGVLALTF